MRTLFLASLLTLAACNGDDDETGADETGTEETGTEETDTDVNTECSASTEEVALETSMGTIVLELERELAPITTENFVAYVDAGFYDGEDGSGGTLFHRVISGFMIQGGGFTSGMGTKITNAPIVNESDNGLSNLRGTIAMARRTDPDSATSQFFINHADNTQLDIDGAYPPGYAVFGSVTSGMNVVDAIAAVDTHTVGGFNDVPVTDVVILDARCQ